MKKRTLILLLALVVIVPLAASILYFVFLKEEVVSERKELVREAFQKGEFRQPGGQFRPNIVLISVDNLRKDALGIYGNWNAKTPRIDRLAIQGTVFDEAFHPTPLGLSNMVSLATGLYPPRHGVRDNTHFQLKDNIKTLAETLQAAGYTTHAFLGSNQFRARFGLDQGFDFYDDTLLGKDNVQTELFPSKISSERLNTKIFDQLIKHNFQKKQPFFIWIQYSDLAPPYIKPGTTEKTDDPYGEAVASIDKKIGEIIDFLGKNRLNKNTLIILTATKPQNLGEHREQVTGAYLYDVDIKIPLILSHPNVFTGLVTTDKLVSSVDLMPSILDLLSLETSKKADGKSFLPALKKGAIDAETDDIYLETFIPTALYGLLPKEGIRTEQYKLIKTGKDEKLINLEENPLEIAAIHDENKGEIERALAQLKKLEKPFVLGPTQDAYFGQNLSNQKYGENFRLLTGIAIEDSFLAPLSLKENPVTLEEELASLDQARSRKYGDLLKAVRNSVRKNPKSLVSRLTLADLYRRNPVYEEQAISEAYLALKQDPFHLPTYQFIASEYARTGFDDKLEKIWKLALEANPKWATPYLNLSLLYLKKDNIDAIIQLLSGFSKEFPGLAASIWTTLADQKAAVKDWKAAEGFLDKAIELNPNHLIARGKRAEVRLQLGEDDKAFEDFKVIEHADPKFLKPILYQNIIYYSSGWKNMKLAEKLLGYLEMISKDQFLATVAQSYIYDVKNEPYSAIRKLTLILKSEKDPKKQAWLHQKIGSIYLLEEETRDKAKEHYEMALEIDPYLPEAANNYAWIVGVEEKDLLEGFKWAYRALSKVPENPHVLDTLAELNYLYGRSDIAYRIQEDAAKFAPNDKTIQNNLRKYQQAIKKK